MPQDYRSPGKNSYEQKDIMPNNIEDILKGLSELMTSDEPLAMKLFGIKNALEIVDSNARQSQLEKFKKEMLEVIGEERFPKRGICCFEDEQFVNGENSLRRKAKSAIERMGV